MVSSKRSVKRHAPEKNNHIVVTGARVHNLKNISTTIPRDAMSVITGLSGSGKSSLAFDVIYAESNRRYMESLSTHARTLMGVMTKPDVDKIENLSPAIAIDQKSISRSVRSTVGTMTEIYDYLRILFATIGVPHCPETGRPLYRKSAQDIVQELTELSDGTCVTIFAPILEGATGARTAINAIRADGYARVRFNGKVMTTHDAHLLSEEDVAVNLEVLIDQFEQDEHDPDVERIADSVETAMKLSGGSVIVVVDKEEQRYSRDYYCKESGFRMQEITPRHFSFNNPDGACPACDGIGTKNEIDPDRIIPNKKLSIAEGAIHMWSKTTLNEGRIDRNMQQLVDVAKKYHFSLTTPVHKLSKAQRAFILFGVPIYKNQSTQRDFQGVIPLLEKKYREAKSDHMRKELEKYMTKRVCPQCHGKRLAQQYLSVTVNNKSIDQYVDVSLPEFLVMIDDLETTKKISKNDRTLIAPLVKEMRTRTEALIDVGVGYLTIGRSSHTLSGGEAQRIRLAVQIKSDLTGVIYVLDEPTTGLHSRDTLRLIKTMKQLQEAGNTLIIVEHDGEVMRAADWIVDMGPGAGEEGGEVIFAGTYKKLLASGVETGQYLAGKKHVSNKKTFRKGNGKKITIKGATEHNLKEITVGFPLGLFTVVCGVSGSGKSTLVNGILAPELARTFHRAQKESGAHKSITGMKNVNKVVMIDQTPIGRTPRSNAATYTGVFGHIRELFAQTDLAREKGYSSATFSFNMRGGRCEVCQGDGMTKVEMHLLPDMYVSCESCKGTRYNEKTLSVLYNGANIADVLDMSVSYAHTFFKNHRLIAEKLQTMEDVGLGYLRLGQNATHLSGGEAQRIKLATELARKQTGKTLYILDEPTTGLHFKDTQRLLQVLDALVEKGNSVIVVEHNVDVINHADWVIELGPDGGEEGGYVLFEGTPQKLKKNKKSPTAKFL